MFTHTHTNIHTYKEEGVCGKKKRGAESFFPRIFMLMIGLTSTHLTHDHVRQDRQVLQAVDDKLRLFRR